MECRLAGETEVLEENMPQDHFCPSQNPTWPDPGLNPGRSGGKPVTNRLSYGAACRFILLFLTFSSSIIICFSLPPHPTLIWPALNFTFRMQKIGGSCRAVIDKEIPNFSEICFSNATTYTTNPALTSLGLH
jgi:hypothetical protein